MFDNQMAEKKRIEDGAMALQRKMNQVNEDRSASVDVSREPTTICNIYSERNFDQPRIEVPLLKWRDARADRIHSLSF